MKANRIPLLLAAAVIAVAPGQPQDTSAATALEEIRERLERLERQNAQLQEHVRLLERELDSRKRAPEGVPAGAPEAAPEGSRSLETRLEALEEKVELHGGRLIEHQQVKVESVQRVPVRLSGMALFNVFANSRHGGGQDFPRLASVAPSPIAAGGTFRQSVIGLEFQAPNAILGGQFRGSVFVDLFAGLDTAPSPVGIQVRLRTASIEGQWKTRGFLVGQERPIFAPRELNSLAQMGYPPLVAAGNLYGWQPQVRFEQRLSLGARQELRARIGVVQTFEAPAALRVPPQFLPLIERRRPGLEGHFQLAHRFDDFRRLEIATAFHQSTTHVAGLSVPASVFSVDWFCNPHRRIELTGTLFTGKNLAKFLGGGISQSFTILTPRPGEIRAIPVRSRGGWAQITFLATTRLSLNLYGGQDDPNNRDLPSAGVARNLRYAANLFYRLAPNVVVGVEGSQARTRYMSGQHPLNNHYDLSVAYLF